jgi:hypothetical protein
LITKFGGLPEGAGTPNDGTRLLQCEVGVVLQPSAQDVALWTVPPALQTTNVSPWHVVVFGVHVLQTPPLQPGVPQLIIADT